MSFLNEMRRAGRLIYSYRGDKTIGEALLSAGTADVTFNNGGSTGVVHSASVNANASAIGGNTLLFQGTRTGGIIVSSFYFLNLDLTGIRAYTMEVSYLSMTTTLPNLMLAFQGNTNRLFALGGTTIQYSFNGTGVRGTSGASGAWGVVLPMRARVSVEAATPLSAGNVFRSDFRANTTTALAVRNYSRSSYPANTSGDSSAIGRYVGLGFDAWPAGTNSVQVESIYVWDDT